MTENTKQEAALRNKTLSVLANINAVEGFDPHMVTACYQDTEGNGRMYLQAEFSMLWFRLKYPNGRLEQVLSRMNDQMATVEGRVYDNDGNLLANAFVTRYRGEEQFGKDYVQNAGTAAIRKALGNCGFGTPADAVYIEGVTPLFKAAEDEDVPVDAGVQTRIPIPPVPKEYQQNAEPAPAAPKVSVESVSFPAVVQGPSLSLQSLVKGLALISIQELSGKTIFLKIRLTLAFLLNHFGFSTLVTSATIFVPQGSIKVPSVV